MHCERGEIRTGLEYVLQYFLCCFPGNRSQDSIKSVVLVIVLPKSMIHRGLLR